MKTKIIVFLIMSMVIMTSGVQKSTAKSLYDFTAKAQSGEEINLDKYNGEVVLIVNTASKCGFTPQYSDLESLYEKYHDKGFDILDFPCNQFGNQSPESDEETTQFCQLNYGTQFPQFSKIDVNGKNETPLYSWLKSQKGFKGFDKSNKMGQLLDSMLSQQNPDYASNTDIKWNFTKFLIDRNGNVIARFEPTEDITTVENKIIELLKQ